jgi:alpha-N-arabinofuranosidase
MFEGKDQMRGRIARLAVLAGAAVCLGSMAGRSQSSDKPVPQQIAASIEVRQTNEPVSKYEFGMFIEHIGSLVYRSLWVGDAR